MANLTITLKTQAVRSWGPSPSTQWGSAQPMTWGVAAWGMKSAVAGNTPGLIEDITKLWSGTNSTTLSDTLSTTVTWNRQWSGSNGMTVTYSNKDKELFTSNQYNYVFLDRVINAESAVTGSYTTIAAGTDVFTLISASTAVWS